MGPLPDLSRAEFDEIAAFARRAAGLVLEPRKLTMVQSRLARRLRVLKVADYGSYLAFVRHPDGSGERDELISLLTTNVTGFFREAHHFDTLRQDCLPPLIDRARAGGRVRIWSAGCSYGHEAYSIAMVLLSLAEGCGGLDIRILATDIDRNVLRAAEAGCFPPEQCRDLPQGLAETFLPPAPSGDRVARDDLRRLIRFRHLNLLDDWPMLKPFDVVFCRNVLIYFDSQTQQDIVRRVASVVPAGGWLMIGHSERLPPEVRDSFKSRGITTFQRTSG